MKRSTAVMHVPAAGVHHGAAGCPAIIGAALPCGLTPQRFEPGPAAWRAQNLRLAAPLFIFAAARRHIGTTRARTGCRLLRHARHHHSANYLRYRAEPLILASALIAAIMSLQAGILARTGVPPSTIAGACGVVAAVLSCLQGRIVGSRFTFHRPGLCAWVCQSIVGGMLPHLAFFAIPRCGLAVANCLMFTMPLWTGIFAAMFLDAPWGIRDMCVAAVSLAGVVLVAQPPPLFSVSSGAFSPLGVLAGLGFGACGGALNLLVGCLKDAKPWSLSAAQMTATLLIALPMLGLELRNGASLLGEAQGAGVLPRLLGVGVLMATQNTLRTKGLQLATNSTVAILLYTEIVWCFIFEIFVLAKGCLPLQVLGACLILGSPVVSSICSGQGEH